MAYVLTRDGEWSIRVLGLDGAIDVVHTSVSRLSAPSWRPGRRRADLRRAGLGGDESAAVPAARRAARIEAVERQRGSVCRARRMAFRGGIRVRGGRATLATRYRDTGPRAHTSLRGGRRSRSQRPGGLHRARRAAARPAFGINGLRDRRMGGAQLSRRSAIYGSRSAGRERGEPRRLTDDAFVDLDPSFWPDGDSVVFASERTGQSSCGGSQCATADPHSSRSAHCSPVVPWCGPTETRSRTREREPRPYGRDRSQDTRLAQKRRQHRCHERHRRDRARRADDGRTLIVRARSAEPVGGGDIRIDLGTGALPAAETAAATRPTVRWQTPTPPPDYVVEVGRLFDGVRGTIIGTSICTYAGAESRRSSGAGCYPRSAKSSTRAMLP